MERKMQEGTKRIEFSWKPTEGVVSRGRDRAYGAKCSRWSDGRGRIRFHWTEQLGESWSPREDGLQRLEGSLSEGSFVPNTECNRSLEHQTFHKAIVVFCQEETSTEVSGLSWRCLEVP
ncbi:hypothetical protein CapIbe_020133 [Capra ibex]